MLVTGVMTARAPILVVDDHAAHLAVLQSILDPLGQPIVAAGSGEAAVAKTREQDFAVVLMDVHLPGIDGLEAAAAIRRSERGRRLPIIFLTGVDREPAQMLRGYENGAVDYLVKPYDPDILRAKVGVFVDLHLMREQVRALEHDRILRDAAEAQRARFYTLIMQSPVAIAIFEGATHVVALANSIFRGLLRRDNILGKSFVQAFPELRGSELESILDNVFATGKPFAADEHAMSLDVDGDGGGEKHYFKFNLEPLHDSNGRTYGSLAIAVDVTAQVRARKEIEALRTVAEMSERYFRTLIDSIPTLAWSARPDGQVDYYNQRWYAYTGASPDAAEIGWQESLEPGEAAMVQDRWQQSLESGESLEMQFRLRRADGKFRWHLMRAISVRNDAGKIARWVATNTDIDDHQRTEERLAEAFEREKQAREQAERAVQVNELFVGILGHDLRNPMNAIVMGANLLLGTVSDEHCLKSVRRILSSAERMARMINHIVDTTRMRSGGGLELHRERVDIAALCRRVVDELETARPGRTVTLQLGEGDCRGDWDPDRLQQALSNVIGNAIEHSGDGVNVRVEANAEEVVVLVHNQGVIPPDLTPVLFDPFRGSRRKGQKGLGLGLFITQQIVEAHGGNITVSSNEADGTTFRLVLPRHSST
jgi:PAS domain S-box-containing protein